MLTVILPEVAGQPIGTEMAGDARSFSGDMDGASVDTAGRMIFEMVMRNLVHNWGLRREGLFHRRSEMSGV